MTRCPAVLIAQAVCNGTLRYSTDGQGRVVVDCPRCARFKAGRCIECNQPTTPGWPRPVRCKPCWRQRKHHIEAQYAMTDGGRQNCRESNHRRYQRHAEARKAYARQHRQDLKARIIAHLVG